MSLFGGDWDEDSEDQYDSSRKHFKSDDYDHYESLLYRNVGDKDDVHDSSIKHFGDD